MPARGGERGPAMGGEWTRWTVGTGDWLVPGRALHAGKKAGTHRPKQDLPGWGLPPPGMSLKNRHLAMRRSF